MTLHCIPWDSESSWIILFQGSFAEGEGNIPREVEEIVFASRSHHNSGLPLIANACYILLQDPDRFEGFHEHIRSLLSKYVIVKIMPFRQQSSNS